MQTQENTGGGKMPIDTYYCVAFYYYLPLLPLAMGKKKNEKATRNTSRTPHALLIEKRKPIQVDKTKELVVVARAAAQKQKAPSSSLSFAKGHAHNKTPRPTTNSSEKSSAPHTLFKILFQARQQNHLID